MANEELIQGFSPAMPDYLNEDDTSVEDFQFDFEESDAAEEDFNPDENVFDDANFEMSSVTSEFDSEVDSLSELTDAASAELSDTSVDLATENETDEEEPDEESEEPAQQSFAMPEDDEIDEDISEDTAEDEAVAEEDDTVADDAETEDDTSAETVDEDSAIADSSDVEDDEEADTSDNESDETNEDEEEPDMEEEQTHVAPEQPDNKAEAQALMRKIASEQKALKEGILPNGQKITPQQKIQLQNLIRAQQAQVAKLMGDKPPVQQVSPSATQEQVAQPVQNKAAANLKKSVAAAQVAPAQSTETDTAQVAAITQTQTKPAKAVKQPKAMKAAPVQSAGLNENVKSGKPPIVLIILLVVFIITTIGAGFLYMSTNARLNDTVTVLYYAQDAKAGTAVSGDLMKTLKISADAFKKLGVNDNDERILCVQSDFTKGSTLLNDAKAGTLVYARDWNFAEKSSAPAETTAASSDAPASSD